MCYRPAATLIELLIMIGIAGAIFGLLVPAIAKVRETALRAQSSNNLKQIVLAVHIHAENRGGRIPHSDGVWNDNSDHSFFFSLLPYIEHGSYYAEVQAGSRPPSSDYIMKPFLSPADPTITSATSAGMCSYAANHQVFGVSPGPGVPARGRRYLDRNIRDGLTSTIFLAEHYARGCQGVQYNWAWSEEPVTVPSVGVTGRRATFADFLPGGPPYNPIKDDVFPITSGDPPRSIGSISTLTFQVRPLMSECDPRIPQTPHSGGMLTAFGDGSVRSLARWTDPAIFWGMVTPDSGEAVEY